MSKILSAKERLQLRKDELMHTAKKSLGQNFLVSDHVILKIINAVKECKPKLIIEIGPGLGALTDYLVEYTTEYTAIEMDRGLADYWQKQNLTVIEGDALQIDWSGLPQDLLVSNLPYQISSSILIDRSIFPYQIQNMVLMFQKEVAQRIRAKQQTEDYGMLTVIAQEFWTIETVCDASSKDFSPAPKVASRVLGFKRRQSNVKDPIDYLKFVKRCFQQRRRILKSNLDKTEGAMLLAWIAQNKLSDKIRAEELSPQQINHLYHYILSEKAAKQ